MKYSDRILANRTYSNYILNLLAEIKNNVIQFSFEDAYEDLELLKIAGRAEYNGKISLRVPKSLHKALIEDAQKGGISLNQFIFYKLAK